jgi:hypothetical protein
MYIREMIRIIDGLDITEEDRELIYAGNLHRITGHRLK